MSFPIKSNKRSVMKPRWENDLFGEKKAPPFPRIPVLDDITD
jgi:hypothetical protein